MINTQKKAPAEPPKPSMNQGINSTNRVTSFFFIMGCSSQTRFHSFSVE
jgi:hypothetical protein